MKPFNVSKCYTVIKVKGGWVTYILSIDKNKIIEAIPYQDAPVSRQEAIYQTESLLDDQTYEQI